MNIPKINFYIFSGLMGYTVFLSFLKRERDFANVSNRSSCTVWTFQIVQRLWPSHDLFCAFRLKKRSKMVEKAHGTFNNGQKRLGTNCGKFSSSRFKKRKKHCTIVRYPTYFIQKWHGYPILRIIRFNVYYLNFKCMLTLWLWWRFKWKNSHLPIKTFS